MAYQKQEWDYKTPITPEKLNHIEEGISDIDNNSVKPQDIKINYIDNQEIATNEYINDKRVYAKRFTTTQLLQGNSTLTIKMNLPEHDEAWIDLSNSYFISIDKKRIIPLTSYFYSDYSKDGSPISAIIDDSDNLVLIAGGGWNTSWTKVVVVKYTK